VFVFVIIVGDMLVVILFLHLFDLVYFLVVVKTIDVEGLVDVVVFS
jgi:hypothetical protein